MKKVLVLLVFLVGCAVQTAPEGNVMPTNNEIVDIFKRRMPGLTPSEAQDIVDYFSQVDSAVSHFGGGNSIDVDVINAGAGNFERPPLESGVWRTSSTTIGTSVSSISFTTEKHNSGVVKWSSSDPTKFYVQQRISGQAIMASVRVGSLVDSNRDILALLTAYDIDDNLVDSGSFFDVNATTASGSFSLVLPSNTHYLLVRASSSIENNFSVFLTFVEIG